MINKKIPCSCSVCQSNANDPKFRICPRCDLPQVTYSPLWGNGYCVNCMRVTIPDEAHTQTDNTGRDAIALLVDCKRSLAAFENCGWASSLIERINAVLA